MTDVAETPARAGGRYSALAILLHWLIAGAIVLQIVLAGRMEGPRTPESFAVSQLHKSIGITILLLSLVRLAWRFIHPPPPTPVDSRWEAALARTVHVGFYAVMIAMPLTGWLMVSASRLNLPTLLYGVVPWPDIPGIAGLGAGAKHWAHEIGETGHGLIAKLIYVLLALHVAGALKHQLFPGEAPVLVRMAPGGGRAGGWRDPRIYVIAAAFLGVILAGKYLAPPSPGMAPPPERGAAQAAETVPRAAAPAVAPPGAAPAPHVADPAPSPAAAAAAPARWTVAPGSSLGFVTSWSGQALEGRFDRWRADIRFGPEALDRSVVTVTVDLASVATGDAQRDAALPAPDFFDVAEHPTAVWTARRFEKTGTDRYLAHGTLDLRGVKRPLDLPFTLHIAGDTARVRGVTTLDRTAFGVGQGEWAQTDQIPARVAVKVDLTATRS